MKRARRLVMQPVAAALLALLFAGIGVALGDDTEIFSAPSGGTIGPNILLVLDNSGSMSSDVYSAVAFDPAATYPVTTGQNPHTNRCTTLFDETQYYLVVGSGAPSTTGVPSATSIPTCPASTQSTTKVPQNYLLCQDAINSLNATGIATRYVVQWGRAKSTSTTYLWSTTLKTSANQTFIACHEDYVAGNGPYPANPAPTVTGLSTATAYTVANKTASYWSTAPLPAQPYTIYSGKYLNYYYFGAWGAGSRMSIVQAAARNLVTNLSNVNIGLMTYNSAQDTGGKVVYPVTGMTTTTKSALTTAINALTPGGFTPLSDTLYEAYLYFNGSTPNFGKYSTGTSAPAWMNGANYKSPIQYSCQRNFVVFLTDGLPTHDDAVTTTLYNQLPNAPVLGGTCDAATSAPYTLAGWGTSGNLGTAPGASDRDSGRCLSATARYMFNADLNASLTGQQNVQSYFIGFGDDPSLAVAFSYLQSAASAGGGQAYTAADLSELQTALTTIVSNILQISTTFTAPTVAVNAFNRTQTLNDLYVSVFQPATNYHWPGNLKRYALKNNVIVDANGQPAVDATTGFFKSSAQSIWSPSADGANIPVGGAANLLPSWDPSATPHRNIYTFIGSNPTAPVTLSSSDNTALTTTNPNLTNAVLGITATTTTQHDNTIKYARGEDIRDENSNQSTTDSRHTMGDPLHAQPAAVIYGGSPSTPDPTDGVIFVAENDGFLHAFSTATGVELWSFIPQEVLPTLRSLYSNGPQTGKQYTLDGSVKVLKYDANGDGVVDASAGDRVFIYFGQGRGGSTYYALDVTDRNNPKFMWSLGPSNLPGLGQAWSTAQIARVKVGGGVQTSKQNLVLLLTGGYDSAEENASYASADASGNALYMVDAVAGTVLWSGGGASAQALQTFSRMDHAIPSDIAVLDTNGDGFADRMYVGDLAGQVWRFDITNGNSASTLVSGGVIASLGAHDLTNPALTETRRFYNAPDVSVVQQRGQTPYVNIAIGSGYRGHPLSTATQDHLYAIRDYTPFNALTAAQYAALVPVTDASLTDITNTVTPQLAANAAGWKLTFSATGSTATGEKVLSAATTLNNQILFTTYTPGGNVAVASCQPALGVNRFYAVSVTDGSPVANLNNQNNTAIADRSTQLAQTGIAPNLAFLFPAPVVATDASGQPVPTSTQSNVLCMSGAELLSSCKSFASRVKTYWKESDAP